MKRLPPPESTLQNREVRRTPESADPPSDQGDAVKSPESVSDTSNSSGNTGVALRGEASFSDARYWLELNERYSRYNLPAWEVSCTVEAMRLRLDRLGLREREYVERTATSLVDFIAMNSVWPLRAWIGLVLELVAERGTGLTPPPRSGRAKKIGPALSRAK